MKLTIIIPVHNEEKTIKSVLESVSSVDIGKWEKEIIVIDDGSTDKSFKIISNFNFQKSKIKIFRHTKNHGKGAAIKLGVVNTTGDYILIQDADMEYNPSDIPRLLYRVKANVVVYGNRGVKRYPERGLHYVLGAKILTWTVNLLYRRRLHDLYTGYKLIPLEILKKLDIQSKGFEFEAEVTCKLIKKSFVIVEEPISYKPRNKDQGKHINYIDFFKGLFVILKMRFKA